MTRDEISKLSEQEVKIALEKELQTASENEKYSGKIFEASCVYFIVSNNEITEISSDASCTPRGGWFPEIFSGLPKEQNDYIENLMEKYDIDEYFFDEVYESTDGDAEAIDEYIDEMDEDDEECEILQKVWKKIKSDAKKKSFPFDDISSVVESFKRVGLDEDSLYYEWEGEIIDFYDNICETGAGKGEYDGLPDSEWLYILTNLDQYIV